MRTHIEDRITLIDTYKENSFVVFSSSNTAAKVQPFHFFKDLREDMELN